MLQFELEKEKFGHVVQHLDNLMGMEKFMNNPKTTKSHASLPRSAFCCKNKVSRTLKDIIDHNQKKRPAPTKLKILQNIREDILETCDIIIHNMNHVLAATPLNYN